MTAAGGDAGDQSAWWHDGFLWYPTESADGRQRFDGQRWRTLHPGWQVVRIASLMLLCLTGMAARPDLAAAAGRVARLDTPVMAAALVLPACRPVTRLR